MEAGGDKEGGFERSVGESQRSEGCAGARSVDARLGAGSSAVHDARKLRVSNKSAESVAVVSQEAAR